MQSSETLARLVRENGGRTALLAVPGARLAPSTVVNAVRSWKVQRCDWGYHEVSHVIYLQLVQAAFLTGATL